DHPFRNLLGDLAHRGLVGIGKYNIESDNVGPSGRSLGDKVRNHGAWPRELSEFVDAFLVDGDDGDGPLCWLGARLELLIGVEHPAAYNPHEVRIVDADD